MSPSPEVLSAEENVRQNIAEFEAAVERLERRIASGAGIIRQARETSERVAERVAKNPRLLLQAVFVVFLGSTLILMKRRRSALSA